jgi:tetratricopeptide (TPR) repeat protein
MMEHETEELQRQHAHSTESNGSSSGAPDGPDEGGAHLNAYHAEPMKGHDDDADDEPHDANNGNGDLRTASLVDEVLDEARGGDGLRDATPEEREQRAQEHGATGDARGEDGDFAGALDAYKKAAELAPDSSARLTKIAESYAAMDVSRKAVEYYQKALSTAEAQNGEADLTEAHVGLGDLCRTLALSAAAVKSYTRAVRSRPKNAFFRWKLAVALTATGLYDQAEAQFRAACDIQPHDAFYRFQLAELLAIARRESEAIEQMQQVVKDAPRDDYYHLRLGAALLRAERAPEAVPHFESAAKLKPGNGSYQALLRYARIRNGEEEPIALDVEMIGLDAYDEDFVRRIQRASQPPIA